MRLPPKTLQDNNLGAMGLASVTLPKISAQSKTADKTGCSVPMSLLFPQNRGIGTRQSAKRTLDDAVFKKRLASATAAGLRSIFLAMLCSPC